jgi:hypothetical protein
MRTLMSRRRARRSALLPTLPIEAGALNLRAHESAVN